MLQQLLHRRSYSPPSPAKQALDQIIKGCQMAMHSAAMLASENERLFTANERQKRKRAKKRSYIATEQVLTVEEGIRRVNQRNIVANTVVQEVQLQANQRALRRCSKCNSFEHTARTCRQE